MALFGKKVKKESGEEKKTDKAVVSSDIKKDVLKGPTKQSVVFVKRPIVSEKSLAMEALNKYVFLVSKDANKSEIKKEIKRIYGVDVTKVCMVVNPGDKKRFMRTYSQKEIIKKAVVTVKDGQKINIVSR